VTPEERKIQYAKLVFGGVFIVIGGLLVWLLLRQQKKS
jgi:hypothetical protein